MQLNLGLELAVWLDEVRGCMSRQAYIRELLEQIKKQAEPALGGENERGKTTTNQSN